MPLLIFMRTILDAVYYWHHIISTGSHRLIFCVLFVGAVYQRSKGRWAHPQEEYPICIRLIPRSPNRSHIFRFCLEVSATQFLGFLFSRFLSLGNILFLVYFKRISLSSYFALFLSYNSREEKERLARIWLTLMFLHSESDHHKPPLA